MRVYPTDLLMNLISAAVILFLLAHLNAHVLQLYMNVGNASFVYA